MKIGILTQPLLGNYGGIVQNFALQHTLCRLGHTPYTAVYTNRINIFCWSEMKFNHLKRRLLGRKSIVAPPPLKEYLSIYNNSSFIRSNITLTPFLGRRNFSKNILKEGFEAYIVGSDQTMRPLYNRGHRLYKMYLDFLEETNKAKRIAYAASFGVDKWEYDAQQTEICGKLAKRFDAISVREASGVELCRKYLGVEAQHLLDPTMLLSADEYRAVSGGSNVEPPKGDNLVVYILDMTPQKLEYVEQMARKLNLKPYFLGKRTGNGVLPNVEAWLSGFDSAKYVVTDSFHGTVFSIIFNKPFYTIGNTARGFDRFNSLLDMFDLKERLVSLDSPIELLDEPDWTHVNERKRQWQELSIEFLKKNLE